MHTTRRPALSSLAGARILLLVLGAAVTLSMLAAPLLASRSDALAAGAVYLAFSPVCHQEPARSFSLRGHPWAACHRCSGIYAGLLAGALLLSSRYLSRPASEARLRMRALIGLVPMCADWLLPFAGLWTNTPGSRFVTGLAFGIVLSSLLIPGVSELMAAKPWRAPGTYACQNEGDRT